MTRTFSSATDCPLSVLGSLALLPACRDRGSAGPDPQVLTTKDQNDRWLAYSPDGSQAAWWQQSAGGWDLMTGNADLGSAAKRASAKLGFGPLFWSPDGSTIVFGSDTISFVDIWTVPPPAVPRRAVQPPGFRGPLLVDRRRLPVLFDPARGRALCLAVLDDRQYLDSPRALGIQPALGGPVSGRFPRGLDAV